MSRTPWMDIIRVPKVPALPETFPHRGPTDTPEQDVDNPQWLEHMQDAAGPTHSPAIPEDEDGSQMDGFRTNSGALDLLHHVVDHLEDAWQEQEGGEAHKWPGKKSKPLVIMAAPVAADSWRGDTFTLPIQGLRVVEKRDDRVRCVITNYGPGIVYVTHQSASVQGAPIPQPNMVAIPPPGPDATITGRSNSREFRHNDEIFAYPATANAVIDVQDEYGYANS